MHQRFCFNKIVKKDSFFFSFNPEAPKVFDTLEMAVTQAPILKLPDFSKQFIIQTDASCTRM